MLRVSSRAVRKGFTLVEILVSMAVFAIILGLVLTNYSKGRDDSVLNKEVQLMMSRLRLAQEQTASGYDMRFCENYTGVKCTTNSACPGGSNGCLPRVCDTDNTKSCSTTSDCGAGSDCTVAQSTTPKGGFAVTFACPGTIGVPAGYSYPLFTNAQTAYVATAEHQQCGQSANACFPPILNGFNPAASATADGVTSIFEVNGSSGGDAILETYQLDSKVKIFDIRLTSTSAVLGDSGKTTYVCGQNTAWQGHVVPGANSTVPAGYPLQISIRYSPPDGRTLQLADSAAAYPPTAGFALDQSNPWKKAEILVGLKNQTTTCRMVTITKEGVISQTNHACTFS